MKNKNDNIICSNRKAWHDFIIVEKLEVGVVLTGTEVKSVHSKTVSLSGAYVQVLAGELWLVGSNISGESHGLLSMHKPERNRKLLCHKKELLELKHKSEAKGFTIVPLEIYQKNGKFKLLIGIAKGKNAADKRQSLKDKAIENDIRRHCR